jgi:hypothetical protein
VTRRALVALLTGVFVLGCIYAYRLERTEFCRQAAAGISDLSVSTRNGSITVSAGPDSVVSASVVKRAYGRDSSDAAQALANVVVTDEVQAGRYVLQAEMPGGNRNYGASFQVAAPESVELALTTTNGNVAVSGMLAGVAVSTTNGSIGLTGTAGQANLSTTNDDVSVAVHHGRVSINTTNGAVDCDVAGLAATESITITTTNGRVTLLLPSDVSATVEVGTTNSLITFHDLNPVFQEQTKDHVRATIGSGASVITITTTNGDVRIGCRSAR